MMANTDFTPLFQLSIGFDRVFDLLNSAARVQPIENWPPYDIENTGEDRYLITMAVAGFSTDELELVKQANLLIVKAEKAAKANGGEILHRGIATRSFQRRFQLADYVDVVSADLKDGLLTIDLVREVPESMKPKRVPVQAQAALPTTDEALKVEHKQAA